MTSRKILVSRVFAIGARSVYGSVRSALSPVCKEHRGITKANINTERCLPLMMQSSGCFKGRYVQPG